MSGQAKPLIPVSVLTGFLGSGKTTLLNRWVKRKALGRALVLINEFGEVGIDHHLVEESMDAPIVELSSGCLCCTIRGDLVRVLCAARKRLEANDVTFDRVLLETTGLADPAPILQTLMSHPALEDSFRIDGVLTTVDAVHGESTLDRNVESVKQVAVADRLLVTKTDLCDAHKLAALQQRLTALNPAAPQLSSQLVQPEAGDLFDVGLFNPRTKSIDVQRWLSADTYAAEQVALANPPHHHAHASDHSHEAHAHDEDPTGHDINRHDAHIQSFCLWVDEPIEVGTLERWLDTLARFCGPDLLRVKGLVHVAGYNGPWVVHGVQHIFHPPLMLPRWPCADRRTRIVFIVRDIDPADVREALQILHSVDQRASGAQSA